jgi:hypothetical protein
MNSDAHSREYYAQGYPAALDDLRTIPEPVEANLIFGLYALLRAAGMQITYAEVDVISGHASHMIYHRDHPECADLSYVPPVETLFRGLDVTWREVTPSGPSAAFVVLHDWISSGRVVLARMREPLLVYGFHQNGPNPRISVKRFHEHGADAVISLTDCDAKYWRYPLDEGNLLLCVDSAARHSERLTELVRVAARRALRIWHTPQLAGCSCGDQAYRHFARDLTDMDADFCDEKHRAWMGAALWRQWTARISSHLFFDRTAPRFGGVERAAVNKAAFCYGQCLEAWKHWAEYLGPTWNRAATGFTAPYPPEFLAMWQNPQRRMHAAHWVEEARGWEEKAVTELTRIVQ